MTDKANLTFSWLTPCPEHNNMLWCSCAASRMRNMEDAPSIWAALQTFGSAMSLLIPIEPANSFFMRVDLVPIRDSTLVDVFTSKNSRLNTRGHIGTLAPGEGVLSIMSMFADWWEGNQEVLRAKSQLQCKSNKHNLAKMQIEWDRRAKESAESRQREIREIHIWYYGYCIDCKPIPFEMSDDLVPQDTKESPFNARSGSGGVEPPSRTGGWSNVV